MRSLPARRLLVRLLHGSRATASAVGVRWLFVFGSVFAFGSIARSLHRQGSLRFDARLLAWLRERQSPAMSRLMLAVTRLGNPEVLTPIATLVTLGLWAERRHRMALFMAITAGGSALMNQLLKVLFARARPDASLRLARTTGFAFPSGHSMSSAAIYGALAIVAAARYPRWAWASYASAGLAVVGVGASRAYLHVHYPSDVASGWCLGLSWPLSLETVLLG